MRQSNFSNPAQGKACICITAAVYDRRAIDSTATLPLINSLNHLAYLTSTSPRIREMVTLDGGLDRLIRILRQVPKAPASSSRGVSTKEMQAIWKWSLAFQCVVNIGVRGSEAVRTRVVEAGMIPVTVKVLESHLAVIEARREEKRREEHEARKAAAAAATAAAAYGTVPPAAAVTAADSHNSNNTSSSSTSSNLRSRSHRSGTAVQRPAPFPVPTPAEPETHPTTPPEAQQLISGHLVAGAGRSDDVASGTAADAAAASLSMLPDMAGGMPLNTAAVDLLQHAANDLQMQHRHHHRHSHGLDHEHDGSSSLADASASGSGSESADVDVDADVDDVDMDGIGVSTDDSDGDAAHRSSSSSSRSSLMVDVVPPPLPPTAHGLNSSYGAQHSGQGGLVAVGNGNGNGNGNGSDNDSGNGNGNSEDPDERRTPRPARITLAALAAHEMPPPLVANALVRQETVTPSSSRGISLVADGDQQQHEQHGVADGESTTHTVRQAARSERRAASRAAGTADDGSHAFHANSHNNSTSNGNGNNILTSGEMIYREEEVLLSLQLLAYLSKYPHVRHMFHNEEVLGAALPGSLDSFAHLRAHPSMTESNVSWTPEAACRRNVFSIAEKFTLRSSRSGSSHASASSHPKLAPEIQYWAGVIMRNACRKDECRGGIRQCANMQCGKWESFPREFAKCRRCRKAKYCSKQCQSRGWQSGHRFWCSARSDDDVKEKADRDRDREGVSAGGGTEAETPTAATHDGVAQHHLQHRRSAHGNGNGHSHEHGHRSRRHGGEDSAMRAERRRERERQRQLASSTLDVSLPSSSASRHSADQPHVSAMRSSSMHAHGGSGSVSATPTADGSEASEDDLLLLDHHHSISSTANLADMIDHSALSPAGSIDVFSAASNGGAGGSGSGSGGGGDDDDDVHPHAHAPRVPPMPPQRTDLAGRPLPPPVIAQFDGPPEELLGGRATPGATVDNEATFGRGDFDQMRTLWPSGGLSQGETFVHELRHPSTGLASGALSPSSPASSAGVSSAGPSEDSAAAAYRSHDDGLRRLSALRAPAARQLHRFASGNFNYGANGPDGVLSSGGGSSVLGSGSGNGASGGMMGVGISARRPLREAHARPSGLGSLCNATPARSVSSGSGILLPPSATSSTSSPAFLPRRNMMVMAMAAGAGLADSSSIERPLSALGVSARAGGMTIDEDGAGVGGASVRDHHHADASRYEGIRSASAAAPRFDGLLHARSASSDLEFLSVPPGLETLMDATASVSSARARAGDCGSLEQQQRQQGDDLDVVMDG
ncbi:hypothetical protein K437DRAFT_68785 [Tilletiaria anomala UBC 951]|uniref:MYND-type domain-containing protein n=1 Tax=Tilletiaria anomala (strain ATCC 24038 / CBS 436.72 / UBC 951) TaxID=1037660 RepID=A0A066WHU1_TILAU|nr:uncharacterized protein K437DRAFT_68785 [Tilletiaria anomala UBC 951]KDN53341.1 hypothetical protein K437DRAFT_68785 [Tilletiaria anomala UBC 951]